MAPAPPRNQAKERIAFDEWQARGSRAGIALSLSFYARGAFASRAVAFVAGTAFAATTELLEPEHVAQRGGQKRTCDKERSEGQSCKEGYCPKGGRAGQQGRPPVAAQRRGRGRSCYHCFHRQSLALTQPGWVAARKPPGKRAHSRKAPFATRALTEPLAQALSIFA